jgi:hypothetical protein
MDAHSEHADHHHHHEMPTEGSALTRVAVSATLHCLTGCAIGEILGMVIGTALGFSDLATIALAVFLAFVFGYLLTSMPLLRAGMALSAVIPIALASDTLSIATMEVVDNVIMVVIPGAMEAGVGDVLFWGALSFALAVAFVLTVPVNRALIARGKGHVAVHETGIHGGPSPAVVGGVLAVATVFGVSVLAAEIFAGGDDAATHGSMEMSSAAAPAEEHGGHGGASETDEHALALDVERASFQPGEEADFAFRVTGPDDAAITEFDVEHERRLHLIVAREDLTGFQHLHPEMAPDGTWSVPLSLADPGTYRVFADFSHDGEAHLLSADVTAEGQPEYGSLPPASTEAMTDTGYSVALDGSSPRAGEETELRFTVTRDGEPVEVEPYLGADGHLVALREGDLEYLHVHPVVEEGDPAGLIRFGATFPTEAAYRLFLQFKDEGEVHTAEFTTEVPE